VILLVSLSSCTGEPKDSAVDSPAPIDSAVLDTADTADSADTAEVVERSYGIEHVLDATMPTARGPSAVLSSRLSQLILLPESTGEVVRVLSELYTGPAGDYCLDGGSGGDCSGGVLWTSDRIEPSQDIAQICFDDVHGRLFLVHATGGNIEVIDVDPGGDEPYTFLRQNDVVKVSSDLAAKASWTGPCVYDADQDALILTSADQPLAATVQIEDDQVLATTELPGSPSALWPLDDGGVVALTDEGLLVLDATWTVTRRIDEASIQHVAVDRGTGETWYVHADGTLLSVVDLLDPDASPRSVQTTGSVQALAVDETTEVAWAVIQTEENLLLYLIEDDALGDVVGVQGTLQAIGMAGTSGDLVVAARDGDEVVLDIYDAAADPVEDLPPLLAFVLTSLESPDDDELELECEGEGEGTETFAAKLAAIEANAEVLSEAGLPVAVAVGWNFAYSAERCERLDIFDTLQGLGFDLGVLVDERPCYNCTNQDETGNPDECDANSPYYCDPGERECCFPASDDYCALGDDDCYLAYQEERVPYIDGLLPGGAAFVTGGDRHAPWDWNWRASYANLTRADGGTGYALSFGARAAAYGDQVDPQDPRLDNPAPWHAQDAVVAWALGTEGTWDEGSAFSDVLYLPGLAVPTAKLAEWQSSGLYMGDFLDVSDGTSYGTTDFKALTQHLRRSMNHRSDVEPNTWHFTVADLATVGFADLQGNRTGSEQHLFDWVSAVNGRYTSTAELVWTAPSAIREAFPPR